jgi:hypothetical protein
LSETVAPPEADPGQETPDPAASPVTPSRRKIGRPLFVLLLIAAAGGAGIAHAALQRSPVPVITSPFQPPKCVPPAKAAEQVTIHMADQAIFFDLREEVSFKLGNPMVRNLYEESRSGNFDEVASACYFQDFYSAPTFAAAGQGLASFANERNTQFELPSLLSTDNWHSALRGGAVDLSFSTANLCLAHAGSSMPNWNGTQLTVTVNASGPVSDLSAMPASHSGTSYEWNFPRLNCHAPPRLSISVRAPFMAYVGAKVANTASSTFLNLINWSGEIVLLLIGAAVWARNRRGIRHASYMSGLLAIVALGLVPATYPGSADTLPTLAVTLGVYGVILAMVSTGGRRIRLLAAIAAVGAAIAITWVFASGRRDEVTGLPRHMIGVSIVIEAGVLVLMIAAGVLASRRLRAISTQSGIGRETAAGPERRLDVVIEYGGGTLLAMALAYSLGNITPPISAMGLVYSELGVFSYAITPYLFILLAAALVIPLADLGAAADRRQIWAGALGLAVVTQIPDPVFVYGSLPVAEIVFAVLLVLLAARQAPRPDTTSALAELRTRIPRDDVTGNNILAVKIAGFLALIPVAYFAVTALTNLPQNLQGPSDGMLFLVGGILTQLAGWIVIGLVFSVINNRLPGTCGPIRALIVSALYFAVGFVFSLLRGWLHAPADRSWIFFGLQLLLFLLSFSAIWDACILGRLSWSSFDTLRTAYNLQRARSILLYAVPLVLAVIALGQQVATGSGIQFVQGVLNIVPPLFGG